MPLLTAALAALSVQRRPVPQRPVPQRPVPQRPGPQRPGPQRPGSGASVEAVDVQTESDGRSVSAGWLRMNDPGFVASVVENSGSGRGAQLARMIVPRRLQGQMGAAVGLSRAATGGLSRVERPGASNGGAPGGNGPGGNGPGGNGPSRSPKAGMRFVSFAKLFPKAALPVSRETLDMGSVEEGSRKTTRRYHGTALADGTVEVRAPRGGGIDVAKVTTWTGLYAATPGRPDAMSRVPEREVAAGGEVTSVPVRAGQDYTVTLEMAAAKRGAYRKAVTISDGGRVALVASGTVAFHPRGRTDLWIEESGWNVAPGSRIATYLHLKTNGNGATRVLVRDADADVNAGRGVRLVAVQKDAPAKGEITIPITIEIPKTAADDAVPVRLEVSAYDGTDVASIGLDVRIETRWRTCEDVRLDTGHYHVKTTFRYSNSGYWNVSGTFDQTGIVFVGSDLFTGLVFLQPLPGGELLGADSLFGGSGWDERLIGLFGTPVRFKFTTKRDKWRAFWNGNRATTLRR